MAIWAYQIESVLHKFDVEGKIKAIGCRSCRKLLFVLLSEGEMHIFDVQENMQRQEGYRSRVGRRS